MKKPLPKWIGTALKEVLFLGGLSLIVIGIWAIFAPAGLIALGLLLAILAWTAD